MSNGGTTVTLKLAPDNSKITLEKPDGVTIDYPASTDRLEINVLQYPRKFDWDQVVDAHGDTTDPDTIKLLDFLINDLGLSVPKTVATTITKTLAGGTETITVSNGGTTVTLNLATDKTKVDLTAGTYYGVIYCM